MEQGTIHILFALLRSAIRGTQLTESELKSYSSDMLQDLLKISSKHDVIHLLALGLKRNDLITKESIDIQKYIFSAAYRHERLRYECDNLCEAFENAKIPFLPLKGSVICKYYPEEWMRTSCDLDILVREGDLEKAKTLLVDSFGYKYHGKGPHDISLFSPTNIHVELHYDLLEDGFVNTSSNILRNIWNVAVIRNGFHFWHEMPDDMFYFYHIAHMAKHFVNGGCGIRPFIDLWILDTMPESDTVKRSVLLEEGNLLKFCNVARKLSRVWFLGEKYDLISHQMEDYIMRGGVYGSNENRILVQQQKNGGHIKYALSKIFIPYDVIKFHYPILQKYRWLTPIMEIRRWCKLIFCGHLKRITKELNYNSKVSNSDSANTQKFLNAIGL